MFKKIQKTTLSQLQNKFINSLKTNVPMRKNVR